MLSHIKSGMKKSVILAVVIMLFSSFELKAQFKETAVPDYYLQYVPAAADIGLGLLGVKSRNPLPDRLIAAGVGYIAEAIMVNSIKFVIREERPDGSAYNSFFSGHSATAFLGAELVRHEYGWGWGAAAYTVATSVAVLRVYHKRHYWWDTVAGAGCGILSANIGYWTLKPVKRLFGIEIPETVLASVYPEADPFLGSYGLALNITF